MGVGERTRWNAALYLPRCDASRQAQRLRVHSGQGSAAAAAPPTDLVWTGRNVWNNAGDTAVLYDPTGREVSRFSY